MEENQCRKKSPLVPNPWSFVVCSVRAAPCRFVLLRIETSEGMKVVRACALSESKNINTLEQKEVSTRLD